MSMKNSSDTIGNRTRDVPVCSAVNFLDTHKTVDRHLLYNLPAINIGMIKIPFTSEYDIKENN
jgi:hypothetical protein